MGCIDLRLSRSARCVQKYEQNNPVETPENMATPAIRDILELTESAGVDERLESALASDAAFCSRVISVVGLPGLGGRARGVEAADLRPLLGLRIVQQVIAGLLLEDAEADATGVGIVAAVAAHAVATKVPIAKGEEAFLTAWLSVTPAWRQAPASWGPSEELAHALDRHASLPTGAQLVGARADMIAQAVRLGELLANLASPYHDASAVEAMQRAARLGLSPRDLASLCADIALHCAEWSRVLGRTLNGDPKLDLDAPGQADAIRFAGELAEVYQYLLRNAAIDAETGLPNARYFNARLETEWAAARRRGAALSVIAVEYVSEGGGDIAQAARSLRETARMQDVVCRTGEHRFMLICTDTHEEFAAKAAARIEKAVSGAGARVHLGVATLDSMISSVEDLTERAVAASHTALKNRTGFAVWHEAA
jgi:diguanylate cyclase (GGDEF)-like protein